MARPIPGPQEGELSEPYRHTQVGWTIIVLVGAAVYTHHDVYFSFIGYFWLAAWYILCMVDALLMKKITDTVPMTTFSRTLYNVCTNPCLRNSVVAP